MILMVKGLNVCGLCARYISVCLDFWQVKCNAVNKCLMRMLVQTKEGEVFTLYFYYRVEEGT